MYGPIVQTLSAPTPALPMRTKPCARWLHAMAKYALEERSNTVLAGEYRSLFLTTACSRKKSHRLDVNLIYNVKARFERCHVVGALGTQGARGYQQD